MITVPHLHVIGPITSTPTLTPGAATLTDRHFANNAAIARSKMRLEYAEQAVDLTGARRFDHYESLLPSTATSDDCQLQEGTIGVQEPYITTGDIQGAGAINRKATVMVGLGPEYVDDADILILVTGGVKGVLPDAANAMIDVLCYHNDHTDTTGTAASADICTTAAQDIHSTTFAEKAFNITDTGIVKGDYLAIEINLTATDNSAGAGVEVACSSIILSFASRG